MQDNLDNLPDYQIKLTPIASGNYKLRADLQLPDKDMGLILDELEGLFKHCLEKYGRTIYCLDLSLLKDNMQMEYMQHLLRVNKIVQKYFVGDESRENGNYVLAYGFAPYLETVINVALAVSPNHNIRLISKEELEPKVKEIIG